MLFYGENRKKCIFYSLLYFWKEATLKLESKFQSELIKEIKELFPEAIVTKMEPFQGFPDILILYKNKWATLECKRGATAKHQPNQEYYVEKLNAMSFSRFIYPENKEAVLNDLQHTFEPRRAARILRSK
jgi:hypothetical protein